MVVVIVDVAVVVAVVVVVVVVAVAPSGTQQQQSSGITTSQKCNAQQVHVETQTAKQTLSPGGLRGHGAIQ